MVSPDISELNFAKKQRCKKPVQRRNTVPFNLTRMQCVSKIGEVLALTREITPIRSTVKLDLHTFLSLGGRIPDHLKPICNSHLEMMQHHAKSFRMDSHNLEQNYLQPQ